MNRPDILENTANILFDAYNQGTLRHGSSSHCAVGTLLKATAKKHNVTDYEAGFNIWPNLIGFTPVNEKGKIMPPDEDILFDFCEENELRKNIEKCNLLFNLSGYTKKELSKIEHTFEIALHDLESGYVTYDFDTDFEIRQKYALLGLNAVMDVLTNDIHADKINDENTDHKKTNKKKESSHLPVRIGAALVSFVVGFFLFR